MSATKNFILCYKEMNFDKLVKSSMYDPNIYKYNIEPFLWKSKQQTLDDIKTLYLFLTDHSVNLLVSNLYEIMSEQKNLGKNIVNEVALKKSMGETKKSLKKLEKKLEQAKQPKIVDVISELKKLDMDDLENDLDVILFLLEDMNPSVVGNLREKFIEYIKIVPNWIQK